MYNTQYLHDLLVPLIDFSGRNAYIHNPTQQSDTKCIYRQQEPHTVRDKFLIEIWTNTRSRQFTFPSALWRLMKDFHDCG